MAWPEAALLTLAAPADRVRARLWRRVSRTAIGRTCATDRDARLAALGAGHLLGALLVTVVAPMWTLLLAPVVLGVPHLLSDLRYLVLDRTRPLGREVLIALGVPLVALVALRIAAGVTGEDLSGLEVGCGLASVAAAVMLAPGSWLRRLALLAGTLLAGVPMLLYARDSLAWLGQLHNAIALAIWVAWLGNAPEASPSRWRTALRFAAPLFYALACLAILAGVFDPLFSAVHAWRPAAGLSLDDLAESIAPDVPVAMAVRLVALFAFGQAMHYAIWLRLIPQTRRPGRGPASFRQGLTAFRRDFGTAGFALAAAGCLAVPLAAFASPLAARGGYLTVVAFHAWLEIAVLASRWVAA